MDQDSVDVDRLNLQDRLLLAQAVYELGTGKWKHTASLLSKHPLLASKPKNFWSEASCQAFYHRLLQDTGLAQ
jgi:bromodomain-containing protein 8